MKLTVLLLAIFISAASFAEQAERCTVIHVKEAMELNRQRRSQYRADNNRGAARILNQLILLEKIMLPFSASLDRSVIKLQNAGVPMWCEDLVSMSTVPAYQAQATKPQNEFIPLERTIRKKLKKQMKEFDFASRDELYEFIATIIHQELHDTHYNCLMRHFLEAAARSLKLSQKHYDQAPQELRPVVVKALEKLIHQLARSLIFAAIIDKNAAVYQAQGIPVLCQEMPPVSWQ